MVLLPILPRSAILLLLLPLGSIYSTVLECEIYIAESTIPNAGTGIFMGAAKSVDDVVGNGDKVIPLVDLTWHHDATNKPRLESLANPSGPYVWTGVQNGMALETEGKFDVSAFSPGIDAMANCHPGLRNMGKSPPVYNENGIHRSKHPGAGSISPYDADKSEVMRDIPIGGEIFKDYGRQYFISRPHFGNIPLEWEYDDVLELLNNMVTLLVKNNGIDVLPSTVYDELIMEFKILWDSRTLNAIHDFAWEYIQRAIDDDHFGEILQPNATRSIEWLNENGKCIDHIVHGRSTIDGAGSGAFAKRDLPKDTIVTGTPLLVFDIEWFHMYRSQVCPDGTVVHNTTVGPYSQQLLLNYCFGHPESTVILCPYGSGVNSINHKKTTANIRVQWARNGRTNHKDESFFRPPTNSTKVALDYVATRDIDEGEELFLDYGDLWEDKLNQYSESWNSRKPFDEYVSATEFNMHHGKDPILTMDEQLLNPYPDNLSIRCHWLVSESSQKVFTREDSDLSSWENEDFNNSGYECDILRRYEKNKSYWVRVVQENNAYKRVTNVPREGIKFADNPYTTDIHMDNAFRQPIGIPDDILPLAWRNLIDDEDEKHCSTEDPTCNAKEKWKTSRDPCRISTNSNSRKSKTRGV